MDNSPITVELIYALPDQQNLISLTVERGTTVKQAIDKSGILTQYPEIAIHQAKVGIFSKAISLDTILREGDRIEIYRPLKIDPKQARRKKAANKKQPTPKT